MKPAMIIRGGNQSAVTAQKPWGHETTLAVSSRVALKELTLNPGESLSQQVHIFKDEIYFVVQGAARLELGLASEVVHLLSTRDVVFLPRGLVHRLIAEDEGVTILEASTPEVTDIIRTGDRYGRAVNGGFDPQIYCAIVPGIKQRLYEALSVGVSLVAAYQRLRRA